jgi:hypothetical protein
MKVSHISKLPIPTGEDVNVQEIREGNFNLIQSDFPNTGRDVILSAP